MNPYDTLTHIKILDSAIPDLLISSSPHKHRLMEMFVGPIKTSMFSFFSRLGFFSSESMQHVLIKYLRKFEDQFFFNMMTR